MSNIYYGQQDPGSRSYIPFRIWGEGSNALDFESHIRGRRFVRGRCDACEICVCEWQQIDFIPCSDCDICYDCQARMAHGDAIIIATDGACRRNGQPDSVAGCGVFFGIDSIHNHCFQLGGTRPTNQQAELHAAIYALTKAKNILTNGGADNHISEVVIKTDSAYLVNGMVSWITKWRNNGYTNTRGTPVANQELFSELDRLCDVLDDHGIRARFWWVPRADNAPADKLANAALDGDNWKTFSDEYWFEGGNKPYIHY